MENFAFWNEDCVIGANKIPDNSVDLVVCDPPFGINESHFKTIYRREWDVGADCIMPGYVEAPDDYYEFTKDWLTQAQRIIKPTGTIYVISGWTHLGKVLRAVAELHLIELNHCIWKYNFGVFATQKFVSSHYHILRLGKTKHSKFNTYCRFGPQERRYNKPGRSRSLLFDDLEDVFVISKEYHPGEKKNKNKLPNALIEKLVLYSSDVGDTVCDLFLGNFTTAYVSLQLSRRVIGFELNTAIFNHHLPLIQGIEFGCGLNELKKVEVMIPKKAGKPITADDRWMILWRFDCLRASGMTKKKALLELEAEFGRGHFGLINIIKERKTPPLAFVLLAIDQRVIDGFK